MTTPADIARAHIDSQPQVRRADLRTKPARVAREPRRLNIRLSGFVWALIGASVVGGFLNTVGIVILAVVFGSQS